MSFHPGQRVVCVAENFAWHPSTPLLTRWRGRGEDPKRGEVYVVSKVQAEAGLVFLGLDGFELRYASHGFRPVVEGELETLRRLAAKPERELAEC